MTNTIQETAAGATQEQIEKFLTLKGRNPEDYLVYPFVKRPYIENKETKKIFFIDKIEAAIAAHEAKYK